MCPFLADLRAWLGVTSDAVWDRCLSVPAGQPFRLHLLRVMSEICRDPDAAFTALYVPLRVNYRLKPCPVMAPGLPPDPNPRPLQCCTSAWQSALSQPATIDTLLREEVEEDWIREVPGGVAALRDQCPHCVVGKLGLVQAPGRAPRLVVDSSVCH